MKKNLANRMRPQTINDFFGQEHLVDSNKVIDALIKKQQLVHMILFGPPGCGKTTLAMILAQTFKMNHQFLNATIHAKKDLENAIIYLKQYGGGLLIIDEIHRLNRDKQEVLLSYTENSDIIFIGLTSTNPYYQIIQPLRSRCHLMELHPISTESIQKALVSAIISSEGLNNEYEVEPEAVEHIARIANGDLRSAYNLLELVCLTNSTNYVTLQDIQNNTLQTTPYYDSDSIHYFLSGLQKSIRGSDVDGALFYLARLIECDHFDEIERRLLVIAYEDIGLANPVLCAQVVQALEAARKVGFPEARICLSVIVVDLSLSAKSASAYQALDRALSIQQTHNKYFPPFIKADNPDIDAYGAIPYKYKHYLNYLPSTISDHQFYEPLNTSQHEQMLERNYSKIRNAKRYSTAKSLLAALHLKSNTK